ncbi:MAG: hypothetical protein KME27_17275 [Lyngbya sp. HA4199-MV5]|nr:hypothetical protein [Lyngbya sp. HA4199-MV5]
MVDCSDDLGAHEPIIEKYQALTAVFACIPEVWFWQDRGFTLYRLRETGYDRLDHTEIPELAGLNVELLIRCALMCKTSRLETSRLEATREFRNGIQGSDKAYPPSAGG